MVSMTISEKINTLINKNPGPELGVFVTLPPERQTSALRNFGRLVPVMMVQRDNV